MPKKIDAMIFDLDGVLTDTAEYHFIAWKQIATELGIEIDRVFNEELKGISRVQSFQKILDYGGVVLDESTFLDCLHRKNQQYLELLQTMSAKDVFPGVISLLEELKAANIKCAVASASVNAPLILEALGIRQYFAVVVDPEQIVAGKPAPDIFLAAAEQLHISTANCVGVEDAVAGIQAIKAAQMFAVGIGGANLLAAGADLVFGTMKELKFKLLQKARE